MRSTLGKTLIALLLAAAPVAAQTSGYIAPGSLGEKRVSAKEQVTRAYQDSRWRIGFLHLDPHLAVTDLGYVSNIFGDTTDRAESDFKAQGNAGLRGFFNLGPKVLVSPFVNLEHTWWREQTALRSTNESIGIQLFGDFNRLQLLLQGGRVETQRNLSSELEVPVDSQTDRLRADLEMNLSGPFRIFASATDQRTRRSGSAAELRLGGFDLSLLDTDSELIAGGLAYEWTNGLSLGLGWEEAETTFLNDPGGRSNQGAGPLVRVTFEGARATIDIEASRRDLEFAAAAPSSKREQLFGLARLSWKLTEALSGGVYGGTRLEASALDGTAIFERRRTGVNLRRQGSGRSQVGAFFEVGEDEFATVAADQVIRVDDFTTYGVSFSTRLSERLTVEVGFFDTRRDSSEPQFDRDLAAVISRLRLGGDLLPW